MKFEEALKCMREWKEVKYRNDVYYIDKKGRLIVRYSDVDMKFVPCFTAEQIMSEDWEINMLKNKKKINILEGNVKENDINVANNVAQRNSQDDELMKKIFPHKEVINGKIVLVFPYIEEVYPLKDVPQEVVSKMEKTTLTEQYKTRTLPNDFYYFDNGKTQYIVEYHNIKGVEGLDGVEVLERVPSYERWEKLKSHDEKATIKLGEKIIENDKLKELLIDFTKRMEHYKEVKPDVGFIMFDLGYLANQVKEALK